MFKFLRSFFNDEKTIIGLCAFELEKPSKSGKTKDFNNFQIKQAFITNIKHNILL